MGHYDSSRPGYCASCGAAPGNLVGGACPFCSQKRANAIRDAISAQADVMPQSPRNRWVYKAARTVLVSADGQVLTNVTQLPNRDYVMDGMAYIDLESACAAAERKYGSADK